MKIKINYLHAILPLKFVGFLNTEKIFLSNPLKNLKYYQKKKNFNNIIYNKYMQYIYC